MKAARHTAIVAVAVVIAATPHAQSAGEHSCVVVQELHAPQPLYTSGPACGTRLSPASTFKIPHALVALETGVVTADSIERWDGTKYPRQREWNRDHTIVSSLRPSVLWLFQRIAPRIGAERMSGWLATFRYGNGVTSGPVTEYWTNGRLQISSLEQVAFLSRFYGNELPVAAQHVRLIRGGLEQKPGTMENSLGVHPVAGDWQNARLNAKTGATTTPEYRVSWLVGMVRSGDRDYVFASALWRSKGAVDTLDGTQLAVKTFIQLRILPP
jgi:beta-lactamase class D